MTYYQFESGAYSDWTMTGVLEGPDEADLSGLMLEFARAVRSQSDDPELAAWNDAALSVVSGADLSSFLDEDDAFFAWLVNRKGWSPVPVARVSLEEMRDALRADEDEEV